MNVLFVQSVESDYGQDILWSGLVEQKSIQLFSTPFHPGHAFPTRRYPKNLGFAGGPGLLRELALVPWKKIDVVVLAACKPDVLATYESILPKLSSQVLKIFFDGGDWPEIGGDFSRLHAYEKWQQLQKRSPFDLIFKREMIIGKSYDNHVRPLPFGFNLHRKPSFLPTAKKYDVSFWAVESHPIRTEALKMISSLFDCAQNGTTLSQTFRNYKRRGEGYLQELSACRICLNFRGAGWDTLRFWEAPAVSAFLISQKPDIVIPNNFVHEKNIVYCKDDLSDLIELCDFYLRDDSKREKIARAARNHLEKFHTHTARAEYFLNEVRAIQK